MPRLLRLQHSRSYHVPIIKHSLGHFLELSTQAETPTVLGIR